MPARHITRRSFTAGIFLAAALTAAPHRTVAETAQIDVVKSPTCGCCTAWIEILEREGFIVVARDVDQGALVQAKIAAGIPPQMASCHTGMIAGYAIEGHVPAADIRRLLRERPDAVGLSVPGMPYGSPGMGPESAREAYDVHLIRRDGSTEVFTHYPAAA